MIHLFLVFLYLALDPKVISVGFEKDGQEVPTAGQVASLTSSNNFINFCLTTNKPLTNGLQTKTGSCNTAPLGVIAATTNMPSSKFVNPVNGQDIAANTPFEFKMAINHLVTGNFVNAASNYYSAPQQVNQAGDIFGHTHITVQDVGSFTSTEPLDPNTFAFFKGVNGAAVGGAVTASVTAGLPAGLYRACSINTDANHTPVLVAVAQHGSLDDCVYVSIDLSMYSILCLMQIHSSVSVVTLLVMSSVAMVATELRPALVLVLVLPRQQLLLQPQVPPLAKAPHRLLPLQQQAPQLEKALAKPHRLLPLQQQAPQLQRAQGKAGTRARQETVVARRVVVACVWVNVNPGLGVTTELRDPVSVS
jgi:hypothetical protein